MASDDKIPEHIPPYKLVVTLEAYDSNPDTAYMKRDPVTAKRFELIEPMRFCPGFRAGIGWGFEYYHHQAYLNPEQPLEFCTYAFSKLIPLLNRLDLSEPINHNAAGENGKQGAGNGMDNPLDASHSIYMELNPGAKSKIVSAEIEGLKADVETIYIRCPHGMAIFKIRREPVTCPECGEAPHYVEKYDRWYCFNCKKYTRPVDMEIAWPARDRAPDEPGGAPEYWP